MKTSRSYKNVALGVIKFGLAPKLTLAMLFSSLIPLLIFWGLSLKISINRVESDTRVIMAETANGLANQADEWIDKNVRVLRTGAILPEITSMNRQRQETVLKAIQQEYPWMYLVFTVNSQGMNVARSDGVDLKDYSDRQYYKDIMAGDNVAWQNLIGKTSLKPALVIAVPIKSGGNTIGVMAAAMTIDDISQRIANWKKGETGFAFLIDQNGKVVAHPREEFVQEQKDMSNHPLVQQFLQKSEIISKNFTNEANNESLGYVKPTSYNWGLVVQQDFSEVYSSVNVLIFYAIGLLILTIIIIIVVASLSARSIVNPIKHLTEIADEMSMGNLNMKIQTKSKDELGLLANAIERMQSSLTMAIKRLQMK